MIKFQIIIDKKGFEKKVKTGKGFLNKISSSLALVLSVLVLSTIIGLGIHLVLAGDNPTASPPEENTSPPIIVDSTPQLKEGRLGVPQLIQFNIADPFASKSWWLGEKGRIWGDRIHAGDTVFANKMLWSWKDAYIQGDLTVDEGKILAPNQGWRDTLWSSVDVTELWADHWELKTGCQDGWYVTEVRLETNEARNKIWGIRVDCASPFKSAGGGGFGGGDDEDEPPIPHGPGDDEGYDAVIDWYDTESEEVDDWAIWPGGGVDVDYTDKPVVETSWYYDYSNWPWWYDGYPFVDFSVPEWQ